MNSLWVTKVHISFFCMWKWWGSPCLCEINGLRSRILFLATKMPGVHLGTPLVDWQVTVLPQNLCMSHGEFQEIACSQHPTLNSWRDEGWRFDMAKSWKSVSEHINKVKARFCWLNIDTYHYLMCPRASKTHVVIYDRASRSQTKASRSVPFWRSSRLFRIPTKLKITLYACSFYNLFSLLWPASRSGFCGSYRGFSSSVISSLTASVAKSVLTVFLNWSSGLERQISFVVCPF